MKKHGKNIQQPQLGQIDMADVPLLQCHECGCERWKQIFLIRKLSAIDPRNQAKKDQYPTFVRYACLECGEIFDENKAVQGKAKSPSPN